MYQPRRVSDATATLEPEGNAAAFRSAPRRSIRTRSQLMRTRVAPAAVSVALLATSGAFALNLHAEQPSTAVPAPERDTDVISRDSLRIMETSAEVPNTDTTDATAGDGDDASGLRAGDALGEGACDAARAEDAPVERRVHWEKG